MVLVRCAVSASPTRLLYRIAKQIGAGTTLKPEDMIDRILRYLTPDHLLIIDASPCLRSDKMGMKERGAGAGTAGHVRLRTAADGHPEFEAAMEESPVWSDMLKQLSKAATACRVYRLPPPSARKTCARYGNFTDSRNRRGPAGLRRSRRPGQRVRRDY